MPLMSYRPDFYAGDRVRHRCGDPHCPLRGVVLDVVIRPDVSVRGERSDWWVLIQWDPLQGVLPNPIYTHPMRVEKLRGL